MPKTKEQFEKIKDSKKKEIVSSALYLFATEGYKATSIDDIMNNVGSAHSLFYHYFASKEELFHLIMENIRQNMMNATSALDLSKKARRFVLSLITIAVIGTLPFARIENNMNSPQLSTILQMLETLGYTLKIEKIRKKNK